MDSQLEKGPFWTPLGREVDSTRGDGDRLPGSTTGPHGPGWMEPILAMEVKESPHDVVGLLHVPVQGGVQNVREE